MLPQDIRISGRHVEILPEWREKIETELERLQKHYYDPILHARVEIIGSGHHRHGAFEIHLLISIPGDTITLTREGEFVLPLIVEAFDALDRSLEEHSHIRQRMVKAHEDHAQLGKILRLFPEEDYGFIETTDGLEVYFHAHAVRKGSFDKLKIGEPVKLALESGDKGPQAIWVLPLD
ncbi:MAG: HPF/RaiA family ribosome-associated protein [Deltaproteobacteria bacterium]|nr:HPF/RaiA family ribosome-associated protein [Deltaproteobacteria bacterium]MBW1951949.1 HPF/RaiA family ribosome-associated protein [Deltaproteobacteria bacterium]MBW1986725.1 HPF/RaiA family ribosome-associated protein [Deltaproteobacteria bacterium]MBW2134251.1 HPF/RaiA family ribosome-associated protein [Deltaproteobacteria bacterium]